MKYDILNPEAETEKGRLMLNGKTTLKNFRYLRSDWEANDLLFYIDLLLPSELLNFFSATEIENYLKSELSRKSTFCLAFLKGKYLFRETGEKAVINDDFISYFFNYPHSRQKMLYNLKNEKFSHNELDFFISKIEESEELIPIDN